MSVARRALCPNVAALSLRRWVPCGWLVKSLYASLLFPVGFCMLYLMGFDLLTGVFTLAPLAVIAKHPGCTRKGVFRNWGLVFCGNFAGAMTTAVFIAIIFTIGFSEEPNAVGQKIGQIGESRTLGYAAAGGAGLLTVFVRAVMCSWMVSTEVVAAMMSNSAPGKIMAMWMPILVFLYLGFEHSIFNMFLFPSGIMLGGEFTWFYHLADNEIPVILGDLVGGLTLVGGMLYMTHFREAPKRSADPHRNDDVTAVPSE